jgi:hypothetical protein
VTHETATATTNAASAAEAPKRKPRYTAATTASRTPVTRPGIRAASPIAAAGPSRTAASTPIRTLANSAMTAGRCARAAEASTKRSTPASR